MDAFLHVDANMQGDNAVQVIAIMEVHPPLIMMLQIQIMLPIVYMLAK